MMVAPRLAIGLLALTVLGGFDASSAATVDPAIPVRMQGVWGRNGRCDVPADRFTVTAHAAAWGRDPPAHVIYDPDENAIEWVEEGVVDNFVPGARGDVLVHNIEGFGMPAREGLARCSSSMTRMPWPPKPVAR